MTKKEIRKHIKPYLRYCLKLLKIELKKVSKNEGVFWNGNIDGLCTIAEWYCIKNNLSFKIADYIIERLESVKPIDAHNYSYWYNFDKTGLQKRIDFCKLQLKIVKV